MPKPTASSAAVPPAPAPPVSMPLAIWYFTKSFRLPTAAMLDRLSIASSTSCGTDTFSTMKLVIARPYFAPTTGLMIGSSASPSSEYRVATSSTGTCDCGEGLAEHAHHARAHGVGEFVEAEVLVRAGHLPEEQLRLDDLEVEGAVRAQSHDAEVLVAGHDRDSPCPTCCR